MLTVVLRRRQKFWFLTKEIAVLTTFQHQKVEITKNNPEMRIFMGGVISASEGEGCNFSPEGGCKFRAPARVCPLYTPPMLTCGPDHIPAPKVKAFQVGQTIITIYDDYCL